MGISIGVLVLLILLTLGAWVLFNNGGAIALSLMGNTEITAIPFGEFMSNFVGFPMFYVYLVDIFALLASIVGLVATKKHKE